jgi:predicted Zn finger-like uncharacterized protein
MALATKCPQCGSMFRVVADQLKLRGGLVRCGQCRTVFDAIGSLAYLEDAALAAAADPAEARREVEPAPAARIEAPAAAAQPTPSERRRSTDTTERKRRALGPATTLRITPGLAPVATVSRSLPLKKEPNTAERPTRPMVGGNTGPAALGVPTLIAAETQPKHDESDSTLEGIEVIEMPAIESPAEPAPDEEAPAFVRATERPPRRGFSIVFGGGSLVLALLAAVQFAVLFRADVLTRWPAARPALVQLCQLFDCAVGWPTQPDQLAVIGSELQSIAGTEVLELTAVIRNRATFTQALPALEVTLSDTLNRPVARKVITPADYLAAAGEPRSRIDEGLAAGADMSIRVHFETRGIPAAGFLVYPFSI